jgi:hypothetical protein
MKLNIKTLLPIFCLLFISQSHANVEHSVKENAQHKSEKPLHIRPGQARALRAIEKSKYQTDSLKTIVLEIKELSDNQGLKYLAGLVNRADLEQYLNKMNIILGDKFNTFRQHQSARDHGSFHVTLVNPMEYQSLMDKGAMINKKIRVQLHGLGRASQGDKSTYFVVASSSDGQFLRQTLLLKEKDFHVTLGFKPQDVYGVSKNIDSLIK